MLYFIGLGLGDEKDITVRGLEVVKAAKSVFLEAYTSILGVPKDRLVRARRLRRGGGARPLTRARRRRSTAARSSWPTATWWSRARTRS